MLVRAKTDYKDYGPITRIFKDQLYIVYAVEDNKGKKQFAVIRTGIDLTDDPETPDPLYFPAEVFELVADKVSKTWKIGKIEGDKDDSTYQSFPEFFDIDGFWHRLHDWNLDGDDYKVIRKYKEEYEKVYEDYIN
jgi:hypothetical protein